MNTMKRIVAIVLSVCMIGVLALSATAATPVAPAGDGSYTYDFAGAMSLERSNGNAVSTFGAQSAPLPESNTTAQDMWNDYYEDGTLNWTYPQIPGTAAPGKTAGTVVYNHGGASGNLTSFQFKGSNLLFKATTLEDTAWFILTIKAPAVGTYNVTINHDTANNSGAAYGKVQVIPAFDLPALEDYDKDAHNANIDSIVAAGNNALPGVLNCDMDKNATGVVTDMGNITLTDVNAEEYYLIFSLDLTKSDTTNGVRAYLNSLTFTPVAETANGEVYSLNRTATGGAANLSDIDAKYASGASNWTVAGKHSSVGNFNMDYNRLTAGYTMYQVSSGAITQKWVALKLKAPVAGKYELVVNSYTVNGNTDTRSGAPMNAYLVDASTVTDATDLATLINEDNLLGYYEYGRGNLRGSYGMVDIAAEEYILILQAANTVTATTKWTTDYDHANNFYIASVELNGSSAMIGDTAYATIAAAAEAAQSGDVIKLLKDYVGAIDLPAGVALDLNGYDWTVAEYVSTNASEYITDSVGTGKFVAGNLDLFADNAGKLPLLKDGAYTLNQYSLNVDADDYETSPSNAAATRFWFKLELADAAAYDLIASGNSGLTIGVELDWGAAETLNVTFDNGEGAEAFAAAWAAAAKNNSGIWLYVDIAGLDVLTSDLTVKPVLNVNGQSTLWTGSLVYDVA